MGGFENGGLRFYIGVAYWVGWDDWCLIRFYTDYLMLQTRYIPYHCKMSKAKVNEVETTTALPPAKRSFGARLGAHFKKWWWVHLIIFIAVLLVILLPV